MDTNQMVAILVVLIGWIAVTRLNNYWATRRDMANRKHAATSSRESRLHDFRTRITNIIRPVIEARDNAIVSKHGLSIRAVREACLAIQRDISSPESFNAVIAKYLGLTRQDIECRDESAERPESLNPRTYDNWRPKPRYELGRQRIAGLLNALIDHAQ